MTLTTRLGNPGNCLAEDEGQCDLFQLDTPVLTNGEFAALRDYLSDSAAEIDCTFDPGAGEHALSEALERIRHEAEDAVRGGAVHVILSDHDCGPGKAPVPMILAAGGVHSHLVRQSLRTFCALPVRSGECLAVHYFAVLIGVGATTVNAYLAQEAVADRHARGLFGEMSLAQCLPRYKSAVNAGLLKVMSKMGISVLSSYRGGYNFEAIGLSRTLVDALFPNMSSR